MVVCRTIAIIKITAYHIYIFIARIPICIGSVGVPNPNQVVDLMVVNQTVEQQFIQLFIWLSTFGTPPEPFSACFVNWTPQDCYARTLQFFQISGNDVNILYHILILGRIGVPLCIWRIWECFCKVKWGFACVEAVAVLVRVSPVPREGWNTTCIPQLFRHCNSCLCI